jgi:hypothetical protein
VGNESPLVTHYMLVGSPAGAAGHWCSSSKKHRNYSSILTLTHVRYYHGTPTRKGAVFVRDIRKMSASLRLHC